MSRKQATSRIVQSLLVLGIAGLCLPAFAQEEEKPESGEPVPAAEQEPPRPPVQFFVGGSYQAQTDIDKGGDFSLSRFRTGVGIPVRLSDQVVLATSFKYELASYDFGGGVSAWHNINTLSALALLKHQLDEHWLLYGGPAFRVSAESDAAWSDAMQGGGLVAVNYIVSETLSFGGGLFVMTQIENDPVVLPIITANWKFAENWKLNLGFTDVATAGYGLGVAWDCAENWQLNFGAQMNKARFRFDNSAAADNVGQDKAIHLTVAATWSPNEVISGTAFVGVTAGGELLVEDSDGHQLYRQNYDPAPIVGLKADARF